MLYIPRFCTLFFFFSIYLCQFWFCSSFSWSYDLHKLSRFHIGADWSSRQFVKADETVDITSATSRWCTINCALSRYSAGTGLPSYIRFVQEKKAGFCIFCHHRIYLLGTSWNNTHTHKRLVPCILKACCCTQVTWSAVVWTAAIAGKICNKNRFSSTDRDLSEARRVTCISNWGQTGPVYLLRLCFFWVRITFSHRLKFPVPFHLKHFLQAFSGCFAVFLITIW